MATEEWATDVNEYIDNNRYVAYTGLGSSIYNNEELAMKTANQLHANIFKAFCDENRLAILRMLQSGEKCACVLQENLPIGQSTLSHHMKILCESGVVIARKEGKWMHYSISPQGSLRATELLTELTQIASAPTLLVNHI